MGVTVFYRGSIHDLDRIEDLEDRVVDLALEVGGGVRLWRSTSDTDPARMIRGVIVDLVPGQESTSLLFSPEGWLIGLVDIEVAENCELQEPPWCFVKTQFGGIEGHVALIEMLDALKQEFIPSLEVNDEGGYWESRQLEPLQEKFALVQSAIDGLTEGLTRHGLSPEAAEDPNIVASRIERIARQVHRTLSRPPEHPPVHFADDHEFDADGAALGTEAEWDAAYKENRRKQERLHRAIEERLQRGEDTDDVFENAMRDEGFIDLPGEPPVSDVAREMLDEMSEDEIDEPWQESLPEAVRDAGAFDDEDPFDDDFDRHPLQQQAMDFMLRLHDLSNELEFQRGSHLEVLHRGAGEMMGGLAQALGTRHDDVDFGLGVVQLKRALRGAAFARGALFPLRAEGVIDESTFEELRDTVRQLEDGILSELNRLREN